MNLQELSTLLDYHYWARDRVLAAAEGLTPEQLTRTWAAASGRYAILSPISTPPSGHGAAAGSARRLPPSSLRTSFPTWRRFERSGWSSSQVFGLFSSEWASGDWTA